VSYPRTKLGLAPLTFSTILLRSISCSFLLLKSDSSLYLYVSLLVVLKVYPYLKGRLLYFSLLASSALRSSLFYCCVLSNLVLEKSAAFELYFWKLVDPELMLKFWRAAAEFDALVTRYTFHFCSTASFVSLLDETIVLIVGSWPKVKCELLISVTFSFRRLDGIYSPH